MILLIKCGELVCYPLYDGEAFQEHDGMGEADTNLYPALEAANAVLPLCNLSHYGHGRLERLLKSAGMPHRCRRYDLMSISSKEI